ncbi:hypothetical protein BG011_003150 [Mortierella polycephala]|uniref:MFS general substrate transporter n=1 Tax=Mortierella polycephala TaxID=41804 RepID=A0A9P6Q4D2_9FUNG|nr:hypothetical protein BG011_003150 [Mortierella polycephala]
MSISRAMWQIILMGVICFGTIGMFNAMSSIGNAGKHSPTAQNLAVTSSSIAYIIGFLLAGGTHNMIGPRLCALFGGLTFVLYAGSMLLAKDNEHSIYPPLAGVLLGLGAGCLWVTQGAMMMSYPTEDNKGKYIACFWAIFNLGAVLGSALPLVMNSRPGMDPDDVTPTTYIVYMVIMSLATLLGVFLARPSTIVRDNGEPVIVAKFAGIKAEGLAILSVFCDWRMLLLIPAFFFSNFSYTYQFNDFNGFNFNIRTRSLNSLVFWVAQIIGALLLGYLLDRVPVKRPKRAKLGLLVIALLFMATWVAALMVQLEHKWERKALRKSELIDYEHGGNYTGLLAIYTMFGFCDAAFAVYCYWLMGALSNKHDELSRYAGFFKSIQSLGSAVAAPLDLAQTPLQAYLITNWILCAISIAAMFLVCRTITDTTIEQEEFEDYGEDYTSSAAQSSSYDASVDEQDEAEIQPQRPKDLACSIEGDMGAISTANDTARTSAVERTTIPLQTHRHRHSPLDRNSFHLSEMPPVEELQQSADHRGRHGYQMQPSFIAPTGPSQHSASPTFHTSPLEHHSLPLPPEATSASIYMHPTLPESSNAGSQLAQTPMFIVSDESSHFHPSWPIGGPVIPDIAGQGMMTINNVHGPGAAVSVATGIGEFNQYPVVTGYLQPHEPFDPAARRTSSGSSTRYDEDQEMDSIDTHSILSLSSDHDSIPEMTEMSRD